MTTLDLSLVALDSPQDLYPIGWVGDSITTAPVAITTLQRLQFLKNAKMQTLSNRTQTLQRLVELNSKKLIVATTLLNTSNLHLDCIQNYLQYWETQLQEVIPEPEEFSYTNVEALALNYAECQRLFLTLKHPDPTKIQQLLQRQMLLSARCDSLLTTLVSQLDVYQSNLVAINLKLQAIHTQAVNLHGFATKFTDSDSKLLHLQEQIEIQTELLESYVTEYSSLLDSIEAANRLCLPRILRFEIFITQFSMQVEKFACEVLSREESLQLAVESCQGAQDRLEFFYNLFIGSNFINSGENVTLTRDGCYVTVHANLPPDEDCSKPKFPLLPFGSIVVKQEPLPTNCPPQMCP